MSRLIRSLVNSISRSISSGVRSWPAPMPGSPAALVPLVFVHGRASRANWMSSLRLSTVRLGVGSMPFRSRRPFWSMR